MQIGKLSKIFNFVRRLFKGIQMEKISDHISYKEATKSITAKRKGFDNTPNEKQIENMQFVAKTIFEPCRDALGRKPIGIASFYRSEEVNVAVGGSNGSQHCSGHAIDLDGEIVGLHSNKEIFDWIYNNGTFDQLIAEFPDDNGEPEWVHVSKTKHGNREEALVSFYDENGDPAYRYYEG